STPSRDFENMGRGHPVSQPCRLENERHAMKARARRCRDLIGRGRKPPGQKDGHWATPEGTGNELRRDSRRRARMSGKRRNENRRQARGQSRRQKTDGNMIAFTSASLRFVLILTRRTDVALNAG